MNAQGTLPSKDAFVREAPTPSFSEVAREARSLTHRNAVCRDKFAALFLSLVRYIGAGYTSGDAECWEAAHRCAEDSVGPVEGPLFVARAAGLVRALRRHRDLTYFPSSCLRLSADEVKLMLVIEAARAADFLALERAAFGLLGGEHEAEAIRAARDLANLSRGAPAMRSAPPYGRLRPRAAPPANRSQDPLLTQAS